MTSRATPADSQIPSKADREPAEEGRRWRRQVAEQVLARAKADGTRLIGPDGMLTDIVRMALEAALDDELKEFLGRTANARAAANVRNGYTHKTVQTDVGPMRIAVPRDRRGSFEPLVVSRHVRRLGGFDNAIISLYAKGLTTAEIQHHLAEVYGSMVSRDLISQVTESVSGEIAAWLSRPLDEDRPAVLIEAMPIRIRGAAPLVSSMLIAESIPSHGKRDIIGLWLCHDTAAAQQWAMRLGEIRRRGALGVRIVCSDGLDGVADATRTVWPLAVHLTGISRFVLLTAQGVGGKNWRLVVQRLRDICMSSTAESGQKEFEKLVEHWRPEYPAIIGLWMSAKDSLAALMELDGTSRPEVWQASLSRGTGKRLRKVVRRHEPFPTEQAALKALYLAVRELSE
jgi:putative transposase